jgi:hypothetical protein
VAFLILVYFNYILLFYTLSLPQFEAFSIHNITFNLPAIFGRCSSFVALLWRKFGGLKLFVKASCCCDDEESGANDDCCKDEIKTIKIADDQHKEEQIQWALKSVALEAEAPIFTTIHKQWIYTPTVSNIQQLPRPPDRALLIPAYKLNHAYLFYS